MSKCTRCTYINCQITRHEQNNLRTYFHHQKQFSDHLFVHWSLLHPARQSKIPQMFASSFWWNWFLPQHMWGCEDGVQQEWGVWGPAVACSIVTFLRSVWHWNVESAAAGGSWWHLAGEVLQCHVKCQHWHWHCISLPKTWHFCKPLQHGTIKPFLIISGCSMFIFWFNQNIVTSPVVYNNCQ